MDNNVTAVMKGDDKLVSDTPNINSGEAAIKQIFYKHNRFESGNKSVTWMLNCISVHAKSRVMNGNNTN